MQNAIKKHQEEFNQLCLKLEEDINANKENYKPVSQDVMHAAGESISEYARSGTHVRRAIAAKAAFNIQKAQQGSFSLD